MSGNKQQFETGVVINDKIIIRHCNYGFELFWHFPRKFDTNSLLRPLIKELLDQSTFG